MRNFLLGLSTLLTISIISNFTTSTIILTKDEILNGNDYDIQKSKYQYDKTQVSFDKTVEYRVYIDTTNDILIPTDNKIDFNLGYKPKNIWYDIELPIAIYNFKDFNVSTRSKLISTVGNIFSLDYYYAFNMWDSWKGWRHFGGKNTSLKKASDTVDLKTDAYTKEIKYEKASSGTEASRLQIRQEWNTEGLKIFLRMSVWYYWAWGSRVNHASLTKFSLTSINNGNGGTAKIKFGNKTQLIKSQLSLLPGTYSLSLSSLFGAAREIYNEKEKNNWKAVFPLFVTYSMGGPLFCKGGYGYAAINLFSQPALIKDIAFTMFFNSQFEGSLKIINFISGIALISQLYYVSINGDSHYITNASIPAGICTNVIYGGVATLMYMYLTD